MCSYLCSFIGCYFQIFSDSSVLSKCYTYSTLLMYCHDTCWRWVGSTVPRDTLSFIAPHLRIGVLRWPLSSIWCDLEQLPPLTAFLRRWLRVPLDMYIYIYNHPYPRVDRISINIPHVQHSNHVLIGDGPIWYSIYSRILGKINSKCGVPLNKESMTLVCIYLHTYTYSIPIVVTQPFGLGGLRQGNLIEPGSLCATVHWPDGFHDPSPAFIVCWQFLCTMECF